MMALHQPNLFRGKGLRGTRTHYSVFKEHPWANADSSQTCSVCQEQAIRTCRCCCWVTSTLPDHGLLVKACSRKPFSRSNFLLRSGTTLVRGGASQRESTARRVPGPCCHCRGERAFCHRDRPLSGPPASACASRKKLDPYMFLNSILYFE